MNLRGGEKVNSETRMQAKEFIEYLEQSKSESTVRIYKRGLQLFSKYYGKSPDKILEERRQDLLSGDSKRRKRFLREIEKYHKWLLKPIHTIQKKANKPYPINSAGSYCDGILQMFRYFEMPITLPTGSDIRKRVLTTKDFVPRPQEYRSMFQVADNLRDKLIISMGKDLGWRIGDFIKQLKDQLPNLEREPPIPYDCITEKEDVVAKSFISEETAELLKQYLPTLTEDSSYLFPSASPNGAKSHIDDWTVNQILRRLADKAGIVIPKRKRLRFHAFRKRLLSTCANLSIDINIAKILVGKQVEADMLTYLSEIEHRKAFLRVYEVLRLTEKTVERKPTPTSEIEKRLDEMEKKVEDYAKVIHGMYALGYGHVVEETKRKVGLEEVTLITARTEPTREELQPLRLKPEAVSTKITLEQLKKIGEEEMKRQKAEYKRIIEENNNH